MLNSGPADQYRFNWNTPFQLSPHNPSIVWLGGNRLFKSLNRGDTWTASADLTKQIDRNAVSVMGVPGNRTMLSKNDGVVAYSTIISLSESPVVPGVVWAGTDDGNVQVSRDGGLTFTEVGRNIPGLPANHLYWISRIDASHFDAGTAYVSVDGHRSNDLKPYLFVTRDYGQKWESIGGNLPAFGFIQVVREDPRNRDLLYVGTEFGLYASADGGKTWNRFMNNLPTARVDDILVHPRDNDLIVATHARSVWIADDITALQQATSEARAQDAVLFDIRPAVLWLNDRQRGQQTGGQKSLRRREPAARHGDRLLPEVGAGRRREDHDRRRDRPRDPHAGRHQARRHQPRDVEPHRATRPGRPGRRRLRWPRRRRRAVAAGTYIVTLDVGGKKLTKPVTVLEDVWMREER